MRSTLKSGQKGGKHDKEIKIKKMITKMDEYLSKGF